MLESIRDELNIKTSSKNYFGSQGYSSKLDRGLIKETISNLIKGNNRQKKKQNLIDLQAFASAIKEKANLIINQSFKHLPVDEVQANEFSDYQTTI